MKFFNGQRVRRGQWRLSAALGCLLLVTASALAQQATVPSTLDPAHLPKNVEGPQAPRPQPRITLPPTQGNTAPANADAIAFVFRSLRIEGATALPESELRPAWPHAVGDTATVADIFQFADAITDAYRTSGYALSFALVPAQDVENGTFTIQVIEGFVEHIAVEDVEHQRVRARIERIAARLKASRPLRTADLERSLLLINDLPGVVVSGVLSPGEDQGGAVLTLKSQHRPVADSIGYNSFMPESLGRHIVEGSVEARGLATGSDQVRLRAQHSLASSGYWSIWGDASTANGSGLRIGASGFYSKSDPEDELLDVLEYEGVSTQGRVYAEYPIIRSRERNLYVGGAFEINNTGSDLLAQTFFDDKLRPLSFWAAYEFVDSRQAVTTIKGTINKGLDIFNARGDSRADGRLDYTTMQLDVQRNQPMTSMAGGLFAVQLALSGQAPLGSGGLFSAAECSYGGRRFGRAFDAGVIAADSCVMGSAALHWTKGIDPYSMPAPAILDVYAFADGGAAWQAETLQPGEDKRSSAASAGVGVTVQFSEVASVLLEVNRQLSLAQGEVDSSPRVTGALSFRF